MKTVTVEFTQAEIEAILNKPIVQLTPAELTIAIKALEEELKLREWPNAKQ